MKFTFSWLKDHLSTSANVNEIVNSLNKIGLEVSSLKTYKTDINKLKIAEIIDVKKHPNADKLNVCTIQFDEGQSQVVCGAPNVNLNKKYVFAPPGTFIGGIDLTLKKVLIRDIESDGMLCSEKELEISENHDGIIELPDSMNLNDNVSNYLGIDDPVIEIEITPNRGDCLGVRGIARDLSAFGIGELIPLKLNNLNNEFNSLINWKINLPNKKDYLCPSIFGRSFRNVKNIKSPQWMVNRLLAVGLRPISSIVDITNYIMMDIGRPLHAYDVKKINGNTLTVRISKKGEKFFALNGKTYDLDDSMLVICDEKGVDDLAGIMGGVRTGVDENTTEFFLEAAIFCPISIAKTGRSLNINSDARYRFERGLDFNSPEVGVIYASKLINEICGGSCSDIVSISQKQLNKEITFDLKIIKKLTGVIIDERNVEFILKKLGFDFIKNNEFWKVSIPAWRNDVERSEDLVEEIIRIFGYEKIPTNVLPIKNYITKPSLGFKQRLSLYSRKCLSTRGFNEVITFSFLDNLNAKRFGGGKENLNLVNPISSELSDLRPSII
ncbi:phenylalanine--tRNA ligase subunit beta, partial [Alphaproteobacteria bacterium]|nr:phenylalanine--tRNA ligase subunit beta [Alphaproteobacteria bacterium]